MAALVLDKDETKVERKVRGVIMILLLHMTTTEPVLTVLTREQRTPPPDRLGGHSTSLLFLILT